MDLAEEVPNGDDGIDISEEGSEDPLPPNEVLNQLVDRPDAENDDGDFQRALVGRAGPFDLSEVPDAIVADSNIQQKDIYTTMLYGNALAESRTDWDRMYRKSMRLSDLRKIFEKKMSTRAMELLSMRVDLTIDDHYTIDPKSPDLLWDISSHNLDFFAAVSRDVGLDAAIPGVRTDHNWAATIDLHRSYRSFKARYVDLGFNSHGRMLYFGRVGSLELWLAFRPRDDFEVDPAVEKARTAEMRQKYGRDGHDTRLMPHHVQIVLLFLSKMLATLRSHHIVVSHDWGLPAAKSDPHRLSAKASTNAL
ncbi:uncharacterized protein B0H18DRAFT_1126501 [Fomitopsis serialis]|uniref:uncharacterized protein n=1 Tax=Fomitopsis serialis TaxID=139415 RepID=UPI00200730D0|nr:uncharacterized protein B0H18DRAFT_1126501 [Neoantrodia serialis]KAH9913182.1 hypothetical protein B0H18DRAFT_1126501 [Neoantrodia serialis]